MHETRDLRCRARYIEEISVDLQQYYCGGSERNPEVAVRFFREEKTVVYERENMTRKASKE